MNIKFIDDLTMDIYVKKELINDLDFNDKDTLEKYLKKLFKTLKNKYSITIEGFYDIDVYIDKYYGVVFHLEKEDIDYYDYFKNQVDMRIITIDTEFMYEVEDIPKTILNKVNVNSIDEDIVKKLFNKIKIIEKINFSKQYTSFANDTRFSNIKLGKYQKILNKVYR